jgi:hypothetical protein
MTNVTAIKRWAVYIAIAMFLVLIMAAWEVEAGPFFPKQPPSMPRNTIWINAPPVPFAAAHGWWFGCEMEATSEDRCVLVGHNDRFDGGDGRNEVVSEEIYVSCKTLHPLKTEDIVLRQPPSSMDMWIIKTDGTEKGGGLTPVAFLQNGDVLIPATETQQCSKYLETNVRTPLNPS